MIVSSKHLKQLNLIRNKTNLDLPSSPQRAYEIDKETGTTFWTKAIEKAHFVAGGHVMVPPSSLPYSSIVSRDSIRLAFLISALNDIDLLAADIGNAYLNAYSKEKVHTTCRIEFGQQYVG